MLENIKYAWMEILRNKYRSMVVILAYSLVVTITVLISVSTLKLSKDVETTLWDIGAHSVVYIPSAGIQGCCDLVLNPEDEGFFMNNAPTLLVSESIVEEIRLSPNIADASAYLLYRIRPNPEKETWFIGGFELDRPKAFSATMASPSQIVEGAFLHPGDKKKIMVEKDFAFTQGIHVGDQLNLSGTLFEVKGIVNPPLRPGKANIYMDIIELQSLVMMIEPVEKPINAVLVESKGAFYHDAAKEDLIRIMSHLAIISSYGCFEPGMEAMGINRQNAFLIFVLTLIIMFGIAIKLQVSSVYNRMKDFGVLKAMGWTNKILFKQIALESLIFSMLGSMVAILFLIILGWWGPLYELEQMLFSKILWYGLALPLTGGAVSLLVGFLPIAQCSPANILRKY